MTADPRNTVLLVDDEPKNLDVLNVCLREAGFKVLVAQDGETALKRVTYLKPDIILLDIIMPGIDGFEMCRRLKDDEATKDIPVLFMTIMTETTDKARGFELGAVDYITKPFQIEEVLARINTHLTVRNLQKRLEVQNAQLERANDELAREVAERKRAEERLQYTATHDALTGLANRALLIDCLEQAIERQVGEHLFALLFLDLDWFKVVNDSLGHTAGDQLLVAAARRLQACARPGDLVARLGRDEFAILLEDIEDVGEVEQAAGRILDEVNRPFSLEIEAAGKTEVLTTTSLGIALSTQRYERPDQVLRDAEVALYQAKAAGKARYEVFDAGLSDQVIADLQLETGVWRALRESEERYRTVADFTYDWEYWLGLDGNLIYVSPSCERISGYQAGEFLANPGLLESIVHPDDRAPLVEHLGQVLQGSRDVCHLDFRIVARSGEVRWISHYCQPVYRADGTWLGRRGSNRDITDRVRAEEVRRQAIAELETYRGHLEELVKERTAELQREIAERELAEESLRESLTKYQVLFDSFPLGITVTDRQGQILESNAESQRLLGVSKGEQTQREIDSPEWRIIRPDGTAMPAEEYASVKALKENRLVENVEMGIVKDNDEITWINVTAAPISLENYGVVIAYGDITDRRRMEKALGESDRKLRNLIQQSQDGITLTDEQGQVIEWNPAMERITGLKADEVLDRAIWDVQFQLSFEEQKTPEGYQQLKAMIGALLDSGQAPWLGRLLEREYRHPDGTSRFVEGSVFPIETDEGFMLGSVSRDITERKRMGEQLRYAALHDALTGLSNRAVLMDYLGRAIERAKWDKDYAFALLFLDLDRFKIVNDSLGHLAGDQLLTAVARRLETSARPGDMVARLGGDEFAILLEGIEDVGEAERVASRIQAELSHPLILETESAAQEVRTTASIGITASAHPYERAEEVLRDAEVAMYQAKASGKARYAVFDAAQRGQAIARLRLEAGLGQALRHGEFVLYYQPIVSLTSGQIVAVEALLRWQHPEQGLVLPGEFIQLAEETGLIVPVGEWALRAACAQARAWQVAGFDTLRLAVNVSARQFPRQDSPGRTLPDVVRAVLAETGLPASLLELEITESVALHDRELGQATLNELRAMGIHISVDDFGLGSSLDHLKLLPLDRLKIAQSFISGIMDPEDKAAEARAILKAIVTMAHSLNLKVIAEGVETEEQLAFLRSEGCDEGQGYLFSRPVPAEAMTELLQEALQ